MTYFQSDISPYLPAILLVFGSEGLAQEFLLLPDLKVQHYNREDDKEKMYHVRECHQGSDVPYFLGQELRKRYLDGIEGTYHTPEGYFVAEEDPEGFARFEASFPNKEKLVLPGQLF